jgi:endonuclease/exonuclease/phosphatase family metal-dependent hydrolase
MKKLLKIGAYIVGAFVLVVLGYVLYVVLAYHRLEDNLTLEVKPVVSGPVQTDFVYRITTYNVGFGAYSSDYSFFMDGGKYSRAYSKAAAEENILGSAGVIAAINPDFAFFQEVDTDSTRSWHQDQRGLLDGKFPGYASVFAQNYDSPYLMYPLAQPIGKSVSGIVTYSKFGITEALRRSLPIETGFGKFLDLDRCYSISRVPVTNGSELILVNLHLSAYTDDPTIVDNQLKMLFEDAQREREAGNYVIIGGDFNKDILGNSPVLFGTEDQTRDWAVPLNATLLPEGFSVVRPTEDAGLCPTVRDCDTGYVEGVTFVAAIDGFILSDNVTAVSLQHIDAGFTYSDHNPVALTFVLSSTATGGACGKYGG